MSDITVSARETLVSLIEPLSAQLDQLDVEIGLTELRLRDLQSTRKDVMRALILLDPSRVPAKVKKEAKKSNQISEDLIAEIHNWLTLHKQKLSMNGGFNTPYLRDNGLDFCSDQTIRAGLRELHARGVLAFDHTGVAGSTFYRLVG